VPGEAKRLICRIILGLFGCSHEPGSFDLQQ
jgi:hypothetical protein